MAGNQASLCSQFTINNKAENLIETYIAGSNKRRYYAYICIEVSEEETYCGNAATGARV